MKFASSVFGGIEGIVHWVYFVILCTLASDMRYYLGVYIYWLDLACGCHLGFDGKKQKENQVRCLKSLLMNLLRLMENNLRRENSHVSTEVNLAAALWHLKLLSLFKRAQSTRVAISSQRALFDGVKG